LKQCQQFRTLYSVGRGPTSTTEPSVQLDLESGTICRQTSYSQTWHIAVSDSRRRRFYLVSWTKLQCKSNPSLWWSSWWW